MQSSVQAETRERLGLRLFVAVLAALVAAFVLQLVLQVGIGAWLDRDDNKPEYISPRTRTG